MISIIVPVYNSAHYIHRCIESIIEQTYAEWEAILVNDGSTDNTVELILPFLSDARIKFHSKENGGVSSARNYGISKSSGDYILFLDADDWLAANACETLINLMTYKNTDCIVFGFNQTHGHVWAPDYNKDYAAKEDFKRDFDYWLNTELLSSSVNKLYKRELIASVFPEDISFGEDLVFSLNYLSQCERVSFITDALYQHEVFNSNSITHSFKKNRLSDLEIAQSSIINFADIMTSSTNHKYCIDLINIVKALFRQKDLTTRDKVEILTKWYNTCFLRTIKLGKIELPFGKYVYARMLQLGCWNILSILHGVNNKIKAII